MMGGGKSKHNLYSNTVGSRTRRDRTNLLFPDEVDNKYSVTRQGIGFSQGGLTSNSMPNINFGEINQNETETYISALFVAMYYLLKDKFGEMKNKKLIDFLQQIYKLSTIEKESLLNCSGFTKFQNFCKNKPIHQDYGYEVVRRFMTKYFYDYSGVFMKLKKHEWEQYAGRFLKSQ